MRPTIADFELTDGTVHEGIRVTLASKIQFERSARANRWDPEENPFTTAAFLAWHAAKLRGLIDLDWDRFLVECVDVSVTNPEPAAPEADDTDRPTEPASGTTSP